VATAEQIEWEGTPSQVINLGTFALVGLFFWLAIPLFVGLWRWLVTKNTKYFLTSERLRTETGVFNKTTDEVELYRVRDYRVDRPFVLRLFSLGNVVLTTSDKSHPRVVITAIPQAEELREKIRSLVEVMRERKGIREIDVE
jgi:uncharacterized membrane protein YdbT with pleckstrin-like domain